MKKEIEYVIRYDDGHKIGTMYCINKDNMTDLVDTLERNNINYMVIKVKGLENHQARWLSDCDDLFKEEDE